MSVVWLYLAYAAGCMTTLAVVYFGFCVSRRRAQRDEDCEE